MNFSFKLIDMDLDNLQASEPWEKVEFYGIVNTWKIFPA